MIQPGQWLPSIGDQFFESDLARSQVDREGRDELVIELAQGPKSVADTRRLALLVLPRLARVD